MEENLFELIQANHDRAISALRLRRRKEEVAQRLAQAKFDKRSAWEAHAQYQGSLRSFLDRLKGVMEEKAELLAKDLRMAEAKEKQLEQEQEQLIRKIAENELQMEAAPESDELWQLAAKDPEAAKLWYRLDALYCIETLQSLLEDCRTALVECRNMMNGANVGKVYTYAELAEIQTDPEKCGEDCKSFIRLLEKSLKGLEIPFETGDFFTNPSFFLNASAAPHNRRDRLNQALDQVLSLQKQLVKLRTQLEK